MKIRDFRKRAKQGELHSHVLILHMQYNEHYTTQNWKWVCVFVAVCNRLSERSQVNHFLCMDLTYIVCLLKDGFGFKERTVLQVRLGFWAVWSTLSSLVNSHPCVSTANQEGEERGNQLGFGRRDQPLPEVQDSLNQFNHSVVCSSPHLIVAVLIDYQGESHGNISPRVERKKSVMILKLDHF